jgi:hypothetical protein
MNVDQVRARVKAIVPDLLEQHGPGHWLAGMPHQEGEQTHLARNKIERPVPARGGSLEQVEDEVRHLQARVALFTLTAGQRLDARAQLLRNEGLGQVIVAACLQPPNALIDVTKCAEQQGRGANAFPSQRLEDLQAVEARQQAVEGDDRVVLTPGAFEPLGPVRSPLDDEPVSREFARDLIGRLIVILKAPDPRQRSFAGRVAARGRSVRTRPQHPPT